jgi:hypothetical protein
VKVELVRPELSRVKDIWRGLEERAKPVYFLSWGWVGTWLASLPSLDALQLCVISDHSGPLGACVWGERLARRHKIMPSRTLHLNTTGDSAYDEIYIEHNGLLSANGTSLASMIERLPNTQWDELFLPCLDARTFEELAAAPLPSSLRLRVDREVGDYYVDLAKVRDKDYLSLLGSSTRSHLRKAQKLAPDAKFEVARDEHEAFNIYDELVVLHQRAWKARGQPGAWADPWFDRFHRRLIAQRFRHGEIQLMRLRTAAQTIGCLYNFVSHGRVLMYQTGINPDVDDKIKPGYLTHLFAIQHNAREGHAQYDFLGGDAQYKKSLSTDSTRLVWARVQKKRLRFVIEDRARAWVRARRAKTEQAATED